MHKRPEMLWKKESAERNAFYVDIFKGIRGMDVYASIIEANADHKLRCTEKKDNVLSANYRNQGNQFYIKKNYKKSIEMYNKALCYAEINSEHFSFAFGNRSLCFFEMKMFAKSLIDIQLAKNANYPESLMYKLDNREAKCFQGIEAEYVPQTSITHKLSFEADNKISNMANILQVKYSDHYDRHIITESDIEVDQTILIEKPLANILMGSEYSRCSNCLKRNMNLIPCKTCVNAMFCGSDCELNPYHRYECNLFNVFGWETDGYFRNMLQMIIRLVLMGVTLTSTLDVDEFMNLVAGCTNIDKTKEIAIADEDIRSAFETLLKLSCFISPDFDTQLCQDAIQLACLAYDLLLERSEIRKIFDTVNHRRFLMHLTVHMSGVFKTNRTSLAEINSFSLFSDSVEHYGLAIFNLTSYLNHSCAPNVVCQSYDSVLVCQAIKPIEKGEQLFIDYIQIDLNTKKTERRSTLKDIYGFSCGCVLCLLSNETLISSAPMKSDSNFVYVDGNIQCVMITHDRRKLSTMKAKTVQFLKTWGRSEPCLELFMMQRYYSVFVQILGQ